mmetsp:Transcript_58155/g.185070  ORF Transcript_58155/g.185070 Transcript_58155/m.185070 type:complete len:308 (-) Transcript_58155:3640-4563(-)
MRCISSTMKRSRLCTFFRCFHRRESASQCSGVASTTCPFSSSFKSTADSPVSATTRTPIPPRRAPQSASLSLSSASWGAMYTHRPLLPSTVALFSMRRIANSAQTVLPEPLGAHTMALSPVLYRHEKAWVWMGLKCEKSVYSAAYLSLRSAVTGSGWRSRSSVGGGYFSGRMRWRKETGSWDSDPIQRSDTTRTKYCGGRGSWIGTVKLTWLSSSANCLLSTKYSWCKMDSPSPSSTRIQNGSTQPWIFSSHLKSGVMVRSTLRTERVMGCTCAASSRRGNWCTNLWIALPILGKRISSPISWLLRS